MEERRKHNECLRQEEWGEIKSFVANTTDYRRSLCSKLDDIRSENKERFDVIIREIKENRTSMELSHDDNERRIRALEHFRWMAVGAILIITSVLIPVSLAVIK